MTAKRTQIENWLEEHGDALYQYALLKTNSPEIAADLLQDTFEAVIRSSKPFEGKSTVRSYLIGILRNKIADHYRRSYKSSSILSRDETKVIQDVFGEEGYWTAKTAPPALKDDGVHLLDNPGFLNALALCLSKLPETWRLVLEGKYLNAKETKQLCQELKLSTTNLWQINHRAKLSMQQCLQATWFKHEDHGQ